MPIRVNMRNGARQNLPPTQPRHELIEDGSCARRASWPAALCWRR